ncbi:MAG: TetR/AcrR family transcriptional regulator [Trueperaceae bacterium]
MAVKARSSYHHGDLRQSLLEKALEHIKVHGVAQLSVREISKELGVSPAAAYRHFADKQTLLEALSEQGYHELSRRIASKLKKAEPESLEQLFAIGEAYVNFALEQPEYTKLMFEGTHPDPATPLYSATKKVGGLLSAVIVDAKSQGKLSKVTQQDALGIFWSNVHGMSVLLIEDRLLWLAKDPKKIRELVRTSVRAIYEGVS